MKTYKIQLMNGTAINVNDIHTIWSDDHGVHFEAGKEIAAYVPHKNLSNYQLVVDKPVTNSVTTTVGDTEVTCDGNTIFLSADKINLGGGVTLVNTEKSFTVGDLLDGLKQQKIEL